MRENIVKDLVKANEQMATELIEGKDIIIKKTKEGIKVQSVKVKNIKI